MKVGTVIAIAIYSTAMTVANLNVGVFGPAVTPINSFFLIGLDLTLRDWLHLRLKPWQMILLILVSGGITYLLNPAIAIIAIASASAFTLAALVDWGVFCVSKGEWFTRANKSNIAGAAVDSVVFPTMAFGVLMPQIILMQFIAKIAGGFVWGLILRRSMTRQFREAA